MNNWLLVKEKGENSKHKSFDNQIDLNAGFRLYFTLEKDNYYYDINSMSGIFVFGYYARRLSKDFGKFDLKDLFNLITKNPKNLNNEIKGIFTILIINNGYFTIINDPLGISKFFFTDNLDMFAGRIKFLKDLTNPQLSKNHLLEYYVFNYCLNGHTFFESIRYATPASIVGLGADGRLDYSSYFDIQNYLTTGDATKLTSIEIYQEAPEIWMKIIRQWQHTLGGARVSLTLTAGLDSRIILGSFLKSGYENFDTFTFGHERTSDVVFAKELAQKYNIPHRHLYPAKEFFDHFSDEAEKVFKAGDSMVSIFRAHRMDAYEKVLESSSGIFMGMAGSDLVRGIGYDGLIISPVANHTWKKNGFDQFFEKDQVKDKFTKLGFQSFEYLLDNKANYEYVNHPLLYLFKVVAPLHFAQDVSINSNHGFNTFLPFLDMDYLDFLHQTGFLNLYNTNHFQFANNKRRIYGLNYSAKLSNRIHEGLSSFTLGKGYSIKDIIISQEWALIKGLYWKKVTKSKLNFVANLTYGEWFWRYLSNYLGENDLSATGLNTRLLVQQLNSITKTGGELHYLDFAKAVNVHLSTRI